MRSEIKKILLRDGISLHMKIFEVNSPQWLIVTHGVGEHLERHQFLTQLFGDSLNILFYDLRGHGKSGGKKAYIRKFFSYVKDLQEVINFLKIDYRMDRHILFGHSMGALITASYIRFLAKKSYYPEKLFLSSPPVGVAGPLGKIINPSPNSIISKLAEFPLSIAISGLVDLNRLSHDPQVKSQYLQDPLVLKKIHTKLLLGLVHHAKEVFSGPIQTHCPSFAAIGTEDLVVDVNIFRRYFSEIDQKFKVYYGEGAYHELHNEIERFRTPYLRFLKSSLLEKEN